MRLTLIVLLFAPLLFAGCGSMPKNFSTPSVTFGYHDGHFHIGTSIQNPFQKINQKEETEDE